MSLPSIKDVVGGWIKPLLPDQWQDKASMGLFYCSAYQNYKRGAYQNAVNDLNIVVSQARRFGNERMLAEAYLLRGISYSRLADIEHAGEDLTQLEELGHPYSAIFWSWFIYYLVPDQGKDGASDIFASHLGDLSTGELVEISASGGGIRLLDPGDEIVPMYYDSALDAFSSGNMECAAKVLKKISEYLQKMAEVGYDASRSAPAELRTRLISAVNSLVHDAEFKEATAESAARQYRFAYDIASSGCVIFPSDPELRRLKGLTARRLSAQVNGDESQQLLKEAVGELGAAIKESGGIETAVKDKDKKDIVREYAIAKSEYAKYFIDNRRTLKKEYIKELLKESEQAWLLLEKEYPEEGIEVSLNRLWVMYRRGKLEKNHSSALKADAVPEIYKNILGSSSADGAKKSEIARLYMWFVLEEANMKIEELGEAVGVEAARELFLLHNIDDIIDKAEKYTKGERWMRDLVWGKEGHEQIMGDILMAGGNKQEAFKCYRTALRHLDTLWKIDHRKWMVDHYRGLVKMKMGFYMDAVGLQKKALSTLSVSEEERVWKVKKALWQALEKRVKLEDPPLEEKYDNIVRMAELAVDNIEKCEERDVDPLKYLKDAVLPTFELIRQHGLCGKAGIKYQARIATLLSRAGIVNIGLKSVDLGTLLTECRAQLLQ